MKPPTQVDFLLPLRAVQTIRAGPDPIFESFLPVGYCLDQPLDTPLPTLQGPVLDAQGNDLREGLFSTGGHAAHRVFDRSGISVQNARKRAWDKAGRRTQNSAATSIRRAGGPAARIRRGMTDSSYSVV